MSEKETGGPAFPGSGTEYSAPYYEGMALRDWFAGQALGSIPLRTWEEKGAVPDDVFERWARAAYAVADAMLQERSK